MLWRNSTLEFLRDVLSGKPINLASFTEYHIEDLFVRLGWKAFLEINEKIYHNLVQTFHANLTIDEDNIIHSRVAGIDVTLSADDIAHIMALPSEGFDILSEHLNSFDFYHEGKTREIASLLIHSNSNTCLTLNDKGLPSHRPLSNLSEDHHVEYSS